MKRFTLLALGACTAALPALTSCDDVLDKIDLGAANEQLLFADSTLAQLNLDYVYDQNLPTAWGGAQTVGGENLSKLSDEASGESKFFEGTLQVNDVSDFGVSLASTTSYGKIRTTNMFLKAVRNGTIPNQQSKNRLMAQAYFLRAWRYFDLVRLYGGVPLVLVPLQGVGQEARDAAYKPRNTTTETFRQIVSDLDSAIMFLPSKWTASNDWGRVTRGAAAALKARTLLYAASPQFSPTSDAAKWQAAYAASQQAVALCTAGGYGLHASFDQLWFQEVGNKEAVFITGFNTSTGDQTAKNNTFDQGARPKYTTTSGGGSHQPTWELVKAFPMKDGKKPGEAGGRYTYSDQLFYKNRDPRFDKTIAYNGVAWPLNGNSSLKIWTYYVGTASTEGANASATGFYCRKAVDPNVAAASTKYVGTDWIEIRYAEVLLNLAEAACGVGNLADAYTQLKAIRQRAGIEAGSDGNYGLKVGMTRDEMFDAILLERQIEFAFEGKRFWDLRRTRKFESLLNGKRRTGVTITLKSNAPSNFASTRDGLNLDQVYTDYFTLAFKTMDTRYAINWKANYYFFGIPLSAIDNNPLLIQNNTWGGAFDPLQ